MGDWRKGMLEKEYKSITRVVQLSRRTVSTYTKAGVNFDSLCKVLSDFHLSLREKKNYVYAIECLSEDSKDVIWAKFNHDRLRHGVNQIHSFNPLYKLERN